ncbi:tetratricopeptide repeat protein [Candidatus Finniella inopinata]|uniref:Tetratricopeptide repeat protein n=1 Tax=Candidatus Finniella inopinata TaxID=1696036 RepID=A0A4Q7DI25_9PROT|nr:hypothetical protein [Candidatus Finniella inopinata]RZI45819.1 hypothetical protein EQU50_05130 [Candidatus Finniella inopinata]
MKKNFFYLCVLFVWSVGGAYAAAAASDASAALEKPQNMSCMAWLEQLETKRDKLLQQVKDKESCKELYKCADEISATIGGKYGISSTPATEQERETIIRSIHRTRQMIPSSLNLMAVYLGEHTYSTGVLSEDLLLEIAKGTQTDPELLRSHLAAIAVVDGASFSLKAGDRLYLPNIKPNILLIHHDEWKDDLEWLLGPIFESAKRPPLVETLIQTLTKVAKTKDAPLNTFLESEAYKEFIKGEEEYVNTSFFEFCHSLNETSHHLSAYERKCLQILARLKIGTAEQNLKLISTIEVNITGDIEKYVVDIEGKPDSVLVGLLYVNAGKKLEKPESWIKAVCEKILNDPGAGHYTLIKFLQAVKQLKIQDGSLVKRIGEKLLKLKDLRPDDLMIAAIALKELGNPDLELEAWQKLIGYHNVPVRQLTDAAVAFNRLDKNDLALTAWNRAIEHEEAATIHADDLIWAVRNLGELGKGKSKTIDLLNKAIDYSEVTPDDLIWTADALEKSGLGTSRTLELVNKALGHKDADTLNPSSLCWAAERLQKSGENDRALEILNQATDHRDITPDELIWAANALEKLPDSDLKTQTQQKIEKLRSEKQ